MCKPPRHAHLSCNMHSIIRARLSSHVTGYPIRTTADSSCSPRASSWGRRRHDWALRRRRRQTIRQQISTIGLPNEMLAKAAIWPPAGARDAAPVHTAISLCELQLGTASGIRRRALLRKRACQRRRHRCCKSSPSTWASRWRCHLLRGILEVRQHASLHIAQQRGITALDPAGALILDLSRVDASEVICGS